MKNNVPSSSSDQEDFQPQSASEDSLLADLHSAIQKYLSRGSYYTLSLLAKKSNVPYSTARRILHRKGVPDFATVLSILNEVCSLEDRRLFLYKNYPKQSSIFFSTFKGNKSESSSKPYTAGGEMSDLIIYHCFHHESSNIDTIYRLFGEYGVYKCKQLEKLGYINIDANGDLSYNSTQKAYDPKICLKDIEILTRTFDTKNLVKGHGMISSVTDSISLKGLDQVKELGIDYVKKIRKITNEYRGSLSYYVALIQNVYDSSTFNKQRAINDQSLEKQTRTIKLKT